VPLNIIQTALSRLNEAKEKNGGKLLPYGNMFEVDQGFLEAGVHVDRNALNYLFKRYVKPVIEVARRPCLLSMSTWI
jgi:hypothetical protein